MRVADTDYGVTAVEVEILLAFAVPNLASNSLYRGDIEEGIYIK
jgi:hypothetical protein